MFRADIEVLAHILNSDYLGVINGDGFGSSEDEVLGDFESQLNGE